MKVSALLDDQSLDLYGRTTAHSAAYAAFRCNIMACIDVHGRWGPLRPLDVSEHLTGTFSDDAQPRRKDEAAGQCFQAHRSFDSRPFWRRHPRSAASLLYWRGAIGHPRPVLDIFRHLTALHAPMYPNPASNVLIALCRRRQEGVSVASHGFALFKKAMVGLQ